MTASSSIRGTLVLALIAAALSGCGGSGGGGNSPAEVQSCLQGQAYGVTTVPQSEISSGGAESRGPGQTGELLVARGGVQPQVGSDTADAVIAFWKSPAAAKNSPNARDSGLGRHADVFGSVTVQPGTHLVLYALRAANTPSARRAAFQAQVKKIESCVS
ncbi:MAG: hypothetical protein ACJ764_13075 [Solirubrobacteraceae bacterium]